MELVFLGTSGAIPTAWVGNVSLVVAAEGAAVLVDLSGNPVQDLLRIRIDPLILLANRPTRRIAEELLSLFNLAGRKGMFELDWRTDDNPTATIRSALKVTLFPVEHSLPTCGVRFQSGEAALVYSSDTAPCSKVVEMARGCSALIHEASGPMRQ